jgi:hypothetical protein
MRRIARPASGRAAFVFLFLAALGLPADLSTAFAAAPGDAGIFSVAAPTGDPAADLAAVEAALAKAKAWQAGQPKGADGLAAKTEVVLAAGTYRLCPTGGNPPPRGAGRYCLQLNDWENLVFRGTANATKLVLLDPNDGYIFMFQSRHLALADLTFDFQVAPFIQGRVVAANTKGPALASIDVQVDDGFKGFADPFYQIPGAGFLTIMDPALARPKEGVPNFMRIAYRPPPYSNQELARGTLLADGKTWRLTYDPNGSPAWLFSDARHPPIVRGDRFVYVSRLPNSGVMAAFCDTVTLSHLTFRASGGLTTAFLENTGPLLVDHLNIGIPADSRRLISSNADGVHFQNNRGPIEVQYSNLQGMADDAIVVYAVSGTIHQVLAGGQNGKIVVYAQRRILPGDRLQIIDSTSGTIERVAAVTAVQQTKCPADINVACFGVNLDLVPASTKPGDITFVYNAAGTEVSIHNNVIQAHRGNGIFLGGSNSTVADNEFTYVPSNGITIGPDHAGLLAGLAGILGPVPDHVSIRHNSLTGGGPNSGRLVLISSMIPKSGMRGNEAVAAEGPSDITISDNTFHNPATPAIDVVVGERIELANNKIMSDSPLVRVPGPAVRFSAGSGLSVNGLVVGPANGISAAVELGCGVRPIDPTRWTIQSAPAPVLLDRRAQCR